jgi:tripartite-type tricarboxylate transporter receptor subunit TctC
MPIIFSKTDTARRMRGIAAAFFLLLSGQLVETDASLAQTTDYPTRQIMMIVPTGAGSAPDLLARKVGQTLSTTLGRSFVIENRPGASGAVGAAAVARAEPDGYTLLLAWDTIITVNPSLYKKLSYDPQKDLIPVAALGRAEFVLVAHPSFAPNTVSELIAAAKARPGQINYASAGIGEVHHLAMAMLAAQTGIQIVHVPYRGGPAELNDIMAGHVPIGFIGLTPALPLLQSRQIKALATLGDTRSVHLPSTPTVTETLPGYTIEGAWFGLFAPMGTPAAIVDRLNAEVSKLLKDREFTEFLVTQGIVPLPLNRPQFETLIKDDTTRFSDIIKKLDIQIE